MFYNGFNLLVDAVAVMATAFITYRYAIRKGFMLGIEAEAQANPYIDLDTHWEGVIRD
jgi:hypothetical protein